MIDFIEYVVAELRSKRLSKESALGLIRQFSGKATNGDTSLLHPLLHRNVSSIDQQCYGSTFNGEEFFLDDHRIVTGDSTARVLPGVAYLEMARAAVKDAVPHLSGSEQIQLSDVVWLQPIVVAEPTEVLIRLLPGDAFERPEDLDLEFEIFTRSASEELIHCRGRAMLAGSSPPEKLNVDAIKARVRPQVLDSETIYPAYRRMGMQFGPAHRSIKRVLAGDGEVLAELALPPGVSGTLQEFQLHPSVLDGALQACIGLSPDLSRLPDRPALPFALQSLQVFAACKPAMYAWVRHSKDSPASENVTRLDIDLCDTDGTICVRLLGFSSRTLSARIDDRTEADTEHGLLLASPSWKVAEPAKTHSVEIARRHILLCNLPSIDARALQEMLPNAQCQEVQVAAEGIAERFAATALECFGAVRTLLTGKGPDKVLIQIVVPASATLFAGLSGLLKSAALENPDVTGQLLIVDASAALSELRVRLDAEADQSTDSIVRYDGQTRQVLRWEEQSGPMNEPQVASAFKEGGVYLITGGLGGLGKLFAKEILTQTRHAKVVLTGRAEASANVTDRLCEWLPEDGLRRRVEYRSLDVTNSAEVGQLITAVVASQGQLNGILHSAGMIADNFIGKKTPEEFARVLAPKVFGAVNLDQASSALDLDFLALFSSGAAVMGNVGQADYAVANGFMDQFAAYRNRLLAAGERKGIAVSINWPLWQEGGMRMGARDQDAMRELTGMQPMATGSGIRAFHHILHAQVQQTVVVEETWPGSGRSCFMSQPRTMCSTSRPSRLISPKRCRAQRPVDPPPI